MGKRKNVEKVETNHFIYLFVIYSLFGILSIHNQTISLASQFAQIIYDCIHNLLSTFAFKTFFFWPTGNFM